MAPSDTTTRLLAQQDAAPCTRNRIIKPGEEVRGMLTRHIPRQLPDTRAKYIAQQRRVGEASFLEAQAEVALRAGQYMWSDLPDGAAEQLLLAIQSWHGRHTYLPRGIEVVAAHEVGHFIGFQAFGLIPTFAHVRGSDFGRGGWTGGANRLESPAVDPWFAGRFTAKDVLAEAVSTFAGPYAEHCHGGGDIYLSSGELIEVMFYALKYSQLCKCSRESALSLVLAMTHELYRSNFQVAQVIAQKLQTRKNISSNDRDIGRLLNKVKPSPLKLGDRAAKPEQTLGLASLIANAPIDIVALTRGIVP